MRFFWGIILSFHDFNLISHFSRFLLSSFSTQVNSLAHDVHTIIFFKFLGLHLIKNIAILNYSIVDCCYLLLVTHLIFISQQNVETWQMIARYSVLNCCSTSHPSSQPLSLSLSVFFDLYQLSPHL